MAKAKSNGNPDTAMVKWNERLGALAKGAVAAESHVGAGGNFLSLKGGMIALKGAVVPENKLRCIVVDFVLENQFYEGRYDPENPGPPSCYAFGTDPDAMAPNPDNVAEPVSAECTACPNHEWGSADVGRGKACKEVQRLALIPESGFDNLEEEEITYLKIPVTSVKAWAGYVRNLNDVYHLPPLAFITEISIVKDPDPAAQPGWKLAFRMSEQMEAAEEVYLQLWKRYEEVHKTIAFPYAKNGAGAAAEEAPVKKASPRTAGKVAVSAAPVASESKTKLGLRRPVKAPKY